MTKKFEDIRRGTLAELIEGCRSVPPKGEIVLVVDGHSANIREIDLEAEVRAALTGLSVRDAAEVVAKAHGLKKRDVYQMALQLAAKDN